MCSGVPPRWPRSGGTNISTRLPNSPTTLQKSGVKFFGLNFQWNPLMTSIRIPINDFYWNSNGIPINDFRWDSN